MPKPTIRKGPADRHSGPGERILEVYASGVRMGLLLTIRESKADGKPVLLIEPHTADEGVLLRMNGIDTPVSDKLGRVEDAGFAAYWDRVLGAMPPDTPASQLHILKATLRRTWVPALTEKT